MTTAAAPIAHPPTPPVGHDVRLVVADMDGTLLDGDGAVPAAFWPLLERMRGRGILFAPASGRQYATLRRMFAAAAEGMPFIAENGAYVVRDGVEVSSGPLEPSATAAVVASLRDLAATGEDLGVVVCGKRSAYVERGDAAFLARAAPYYAALEVVPDLDAVDDEVVKVAAFHFTESARIEPALAGFRHGHQVVVSGQHWIDVMAAGVDKGAAVRALQRALGVTRAQTVAFGDYLNDLEMLGEADHSYAMDNAHPDVHLKARFRAPSNLDHGVITTLSGLLAAS